MIANLWIALDDRARATANPSQNSAGSDIFRQLGDPSVRALFRRDNPAGPRDYELWSVYYEIDTPNELLQIRNALNAEFPGQLRTIGAWWFDGRQVGTEWELDEDGVRTGGITGQPLFPLGARVLEFMPDDVTYDEDGVETSRTRPIVLSDINLGFGQKPRQFS